MFLTSFLLLIKRVEKGAYRFDNLTAILDTTVAKKKGIRIGKLDRGVLVLC